MSRPQASCGYCGNPGRTKEHVWGRWSKKHIPHLEGKTQHIARLFNGSTGEEWIDSGAMTRSGDPRALTLKVPCRACNMGWMKDVNEAAEPILVRLGKGEWWALGDVEKTALATWVTMTCMTYEFGNRATQVSPQAERKFIREAGAPPPNWKIWIGEYGEGSWRGRAHQKSMRHAAPYVDRITGDELASMNTQTITFTFGKLLLHGFSTSTGLNFKAAEYGFRQGLQTVWPLDGTVTRKPPRPHNDKEVEFIANALEWAFQDLFER